MYPQTLRYSLFISCDMCAAANVSECWKPTSGKRTSCALCAHRQQTCHWPGQPEKPPRKSRNRDGPAVRREKRRRSPSVDDDPPAATPGSSPSPDDVALPKSQAHPSGSTSKATAVPAVAPAGETREREVMPEASGSKKRKRNGDNEKADKDSEVQPLDAAPQPATNVATSSLLNSGIAWSVRPGPRFTTPELRTLFLAELQLFRMQLSMCRSDQAAITEGLNRQRRLFSIEAEAISSVTERSVEVCRYFGVLEEPANEGTTPVASEQPSLERDGEDEVPGGEGSA